MNFITKGMTMEKQKQKRKEKKKVNIGEMTSSTVYLGLHDKLLYRKLSDKLECLEKGAWKEVKVNYDFLQKARFREY